MSCIQIRIKWGFVVVVFFSDRETAKSSVVFLGVCMVVIDTSVIDVYDVNHISFHSSFGTTSETSGGGYCLGNFLVS